ncbi:hypothetical protein QJU43_02420 [Pasteurella atlantica]|uniref:hypothetical protein n=1 Tax=Pasteurellaceae TaxID=712 RepID=UPI00275E9A97|nr:hypothetical protein [Pasteurella atlantica]MDP8033146.1 hypothetical protein [Pasteurella atlantica]MDP8035083.1 hypothetical protein [Pasteurella atlantica]MDP8036957.1 hypothetical protein [Pasteurella atlantica]MDP8047517.1 hypothetical protein [Pasteurella atlantica]MDP8049186.1 hypothetical protein [Pasteurella atlantica]
MTKQDEDLNPELKWYKLNVNKKNISSFFIFLTIIIMLDIAFLSIPFLSTFQNITSELKILIFSLDIISIIFTIISCSQLSNFQGGYNLPKHPTILFLFAFLPTMIIVGILLCLIFNS